MRCTFDLDDKTHGELKALCVMNNITIRDALRAAIYKYILDRRDDDIQAPDSQNLFRKAIDKISLVELFEQNPGYKMELVGEFYKALCPLEPESIEKRFTISPKKNIWYCFKCETGGDVISLVASMNKCSIMEAVEMILQPTKLWWSKK